MIKILNYYVYQKEIISLDALSHKKIPHHKKCAGGLSIPNFKP